MRQRLRPVEFCQFPSFRFWDGTSLEVALLALEPKQLGIYRMLHNGYSPAVAAGVTDGGDETTERQRLIPGNGIHGLKLAGK